MSFEKVTIRDCTLYRGDCLEVLPTLGEIDCVVTDPPYGLSFMGKKWDYAVPSVEVWAACLRVLNPGGHLLSFAGTRTQHRMACRIEDAGFEIRDMIAWCYGSGFPKSHNLKGDWQGWGTALKPALEPITMARKPLIGTVAANVMKHGTGGINVDGCRVGAAESLGRPLSSRPEASSVNAYSWSTRPNPQAGQFLDNTGGLGRWPANFIHDGSDEVLGLFPVTTSGSRQLVGYQKLQGVTGFGGADNRNYEGDTGSAARFFYCAKSSKRDRDEGCEGIGLKSCGMMEDDNYDIKTGSGNSRDTKRRNHHPTVKPTALMRHLCRLVTPPGGIVLDPFMGSGSTGKAAAMEGFRFIGIERERQYFDIACKRIERAYEDAALLDLMPVEPIEEQSELFAEVA